MKKERLCKIIKNTLIPYLNREVVYFNQYSLKRCVTPYGEETIADCGCGPCACAGVISTLTGKKISPKALADRAVAAHKYKSGCGTYHNFIPMILEEYGLTCVSVLADVDKMAELISPGEAMAIVLVKKGRFCNCNHFVSVGINKKAKPGSEKLLKVYNSVNVLDCYRSFTKQELSENLVNQTDGLGPIWVAVKKQ